MSEEIARLLQAGIAAAKAGDKDSAKRLLIDVTERDPENEQAWLWLSGVVDDPMEMRICLENVLSINPQNERARKGLEWMEAREEEPAPAPPVEEGMGAPTTTGWQEPTGDLPPPSIEEQFGVPGFPSLEEQTDEPPMPSIEERLGLGPPPPIEEQISAAHPMPAATPPAAPSAPEGRVACPACGAANFDFASECVKCGFPFALSCPSCNELVPTETGFCPNCGAELPLPVKLVAVQERDAEIEDAYRQGLAYMQQRRYQEAKIAFEQALTQQPNHIEARYNLGMACSKLGLRQEARDYLEEVKILQPEHPLVDKELQALLSPRERRDLARERRRTQREEREKRRAVQGRPAGQTLLAEYEEKRKVEGPVPEELTGALETFLYVFIAGLVVGVTYVVTPKPPTDLASETVLGILKKSGVIAAVLVVFWIILGIASRLLSRVFRSSGKPNGYMTSAGRFLMPFVVLILAIVLSIPRIVGFLPEQFRDLLEQYPWGPLIVCGGIGLFLGLLSLVRGISRVGRIALWKGLIVGVVALAIASAAAGGLTYIGYAMADEQGYLATLGFGPTPTPTPRPVLPEESRNQAGRYTVRYPAGWTVAIRGSTTTLYQRAEDQQAAVPISPTVTIEVGRLSYIAGGRAAEALDAEKMIVEVAEGMRATGIQVNATRQQVFAVSGARAVSVDFTASGFDDPDLVAAGRLVCIHLGDRGVVITGMSLEKHWQPFSPIFDEMVLSLNLYGETVPTPIPTAIPIPTPIPTIVTTPTPTATPESGA